MKPLNKGHLGDIESVLYSEVSFSTLPPFSPPALFNPIALLLMFCSLPLFRGTVYTYVSVWLTISVLDREITFSEVLLFFQFSSPSPPGLHRWNWRDLIARVRSTIQGHGSSRGQSPYHVTIIPRSCDCHVIRLGWDGRVWSWCTERGRPRNCGIVFLSRAARLCPGMK